MNISCPGSWDLPKHMNSITEVIYFLRGSCLKKIKVLKWKKKYSRLICKSVQCSLFIGGFILYIFENYNLWGKMSGT